MNDIHSRLNPTRVAEVVRVDSTLSVRAAVRRAERTHWPVAVAGGRHAMGGQQFVAGGMLIDTSTMNRVHAFDDERGTIDLEAGIQWPELLAVLGELQQGRDTTWTIRQKQTGADRLSIGGALAANVHGRGLQMRPFINDVESFDLVDAQGEVRFCSRAHAPELFRLAIGGYGLLGVITTVRLRLTRRSKLMRCVEILDINEVPAAFEKSAADGHLYGDFQFATDERSPDFLKTGVFSTYAPVADDTEIPESQLRLGPEDWRRLVTLAHTDKSTAFDHYAQHYLATDGQLYWSDAHQMSVYLDDYHAAIDQGLGNDIDGTEIISEVYVPPEELPSFMNEVAADFRANSVNVIYGTVRMIERDDESFLPWARQNYACIVFNLHTEHTTAGIAHTVAAFRRVTDLAIARGGSFYLTYLRHATREQIEACYPRFRQFLERKLAYDPAERFQSEWYRYYKQG